MWVAAVAIDLRINDMKDARKYFHKPSGTWVRVWSDIKGKRRQITESKWTWITTNGFIPEGMKLHHKDFDLTNSDIKNLTLLDREEFKKVWNRHRMEEITANGITTLVCRRCGRRQRVNQFTKTGGVYRRGTCSTCRKQG